MWWITNEPTERLAAGSKHNLATIFCDHQPCDQISDFLVRLENVALLTIIERPRNVKPVAKKNSALLEPRLPLPTIKGSSEMRIG